MCKLLDLEILTAMATLVRPKVAGVQEEALG